MEKTKKNYVILAIITAIAMLFAGISILFGTIRTSSVFADEYDLDIVEEIDAYTWSSTRYSGFKYILDSENKIRLNTYNYTGDDTEIHFSRNILISETGEYFKVCEIKDLPKNSTVREVYIPSGIETLGYSAFQACDVLESVHLGKDVIDIRQGALRGNSSSTLNLYIEATGTYLGENLNSFIDGLILGLQFKPKELGGLEYIIDDEISMYNTSYDISNCRPVHIYCYESLTETFRGIFGSENVSTIGADPTLAGTWLFDETPWPFDLESELEILLDFKDGNGNDYQGIIMDWEYMIYVGDFEDDSSYIAVYTTNEEFAEYFQIDLGWQGDAYKTITIAQDATPMISDNGIPVNDTNGVFLSLLGTIAEQVVYTPETGVVLDIILPSMVIGLAILASVLVWKKKEC